jgi:hypothetical protein
MKAKTFSLFGFLVLGTAGLFAQASYEAPAPQPVVLERADERQAAYDARIEEVLAWRAGLVKPGELIGDMSGIATKLAKRENAELCSRSVIELMKEPGSGPFWMFPVVSLAYLGRDQLTPEARQAIRDAWSRACRCAATPRITGRCITPRCI